MKKYIIQLKQLTISTTFLVGVSSIYTVKIHKKWIKIPAGEEI